MPRTLGFSIFLSILLACHAVDFGDSSCDSSEEHGGHGGGGHGGHGGHGGGWNGGWTRPPQPTPSGGGNNANRPRCDQGWFTSYRPQGTWCIRIGIGKMDYNGAIAQCATYGGVLSGIQNEWERWLIANEANRQILAYNQQFSGMWLGAQRTSNNLFQWTDGQTTGTGGFVWGPGQPDNSAAGGRGPQNCVQLIALTPGYFNNPGNWASWTNGQLDDTWCDNTQDPPNRMYMCGKVGPQG